MKKTVNGFSLIEVLTVIAIVIIVSSIGFWFLANSKKNTQLTTIADTIVHKLEQAKTNALSGRFGLGSGISFGTSTYTYFIGNEYDPGTTTNEIYTVTQPYEIRITPEENNVIIFSRLSGIPQTTATVTVSSMSDPGFKKEITIGNQGQIGVVE